MCVSKSKKDDLEGPCLYLLLLPWLGVYFSKDELEDIEAWPSKSSSSPSGTHPFGNLESLGLYVLVGVRVKFYVVKNFYNVWK